MNALRKDYKLCKTELANMKRDQSSKRVTRSMSKKITEETGSGGASDPRKALFAAIQARGGSEQKSDSSKPTENGDPMQALFGAIKSRNKDPTTTGVADDPPSSDVKYSPGINRLQEFLTHSKTILSLTDKDQDAAIRACKVCFFLTLHCDSVGSIVIPPLYP